MAITLKTTPIQHLKGVGEKRAKLFEKLGAPTVGALLRLYPRAYEDWSHPCSIAQAPFGETCRIRAIVVQEAKESRIRKGMTLYKLVASDGYSNLYITLFNNPYGAKLLSLGEEFIFSGMAGGRLGHREMVSPVFEKAATGVRIKPIYPQTEGLNSRTIEQAVRQALALLPENLSDPLPDSLRSAFSLCHMRYAIENIHNPSSEEALQIARYRLAFEELLVLQLAMFQLKGREKGQNRLVLSKDCSDEFYSLLPFTPTNAQKRAVAEGIADMKGKSPMSRLVQGDVGSGKTAVAAALCFCAIREGWQCAMMAPTEILAEQHFQSISSLFSNTGISCALLTGSLSASEKKKVYDDLKNGKISLVVGTHALLSEGVSFQRLGLVVTDEQHRFGVEQRSALAAKGDSPHMLVMSATPIPRTLALMVYGDLDVSILNELPPGRQQVDTFAVDSKKRQRAFAFIKKHLDEGRQAYIVCPLVEEGENGSPLISAEQYFKQLSEKDFFGYRVGLLHGKMKPIQKEEVMSSFSRGEIQLLISTTVIEVGVDVPNAVIMLIENAERFGLSQLHQLRGRVGRGSYKSYCILISDAQNKEALRRLHVMMETNDGFRIADEDLRLRGPGEFFGSRQHGLPELKIANMVNDMEILKEAQKAAREVLSKDPSLECPEHHGLSASVRRLFARVGNQGLN